MIDTALKQTFRARDVAQGGTTGSFSCVRPVGHCNCPQKLIKEGSGERKVEGRDRGMEEVERERGRKENLKNTSLQSGVIFKKMQVKDRKPNASVK